LGFEEESHRELNSGHQIARPPLFIPGSSFISSFLAPPSSLSDIVCTWIWRAGHFPQLEMGKTYLRESRSRRPLEESKSKVIITVQGTGCDIRVQEQGCFLQ